MAGALFWLSGSRCWSLLRGREHRLAELVLDSLLGILEVLIQLVDVYDWVLGILISILPISIVDALLDFRSKDAGEVPSPHMIVQRIGTSIKRPAKTKAIRVRRRRIDTTRQSAITTMNMMRRVLVSIS